MSHFVPYRPTTIKIDRGGFPIKNAEMVFFIARADQKLNSGEKPHSGLRTRTRTRRDAVQYVVLVALARLRQGRERRPDAARGQTG